MINLMKKRGIFIITLFIFAFCFSGAKASGPLSAVINEIAWMGTANSANDEWIELYNTTNTSLDISGWTLKSEDGKPTIKLSGTIPANGFYILERTDNSTLPGITADKIYTGALSNSGEDLKLFDSLGIIIDEVNSKSGWFNGKTKPDYLTMERINPLISGSDSSNWQNSQNIGGTPKKPNSQGQEKAVAAQIQNQNKKESKTLDNKYHCWRITCED